jgi:hypothetical protein
LIEGLNPGFFKQVTSLRLWRNLRRAEFWMRIEDQLKASEGPSQSKVEDKRGKLLLTSKRVTTLRRSDPRADP